MVVWSTLDRLGRSVVLTASGWSHIRDRHGDTIDSAGMVGVAIEQADEIVRDAGYLHREIHMAELGKPELPVRVVVHFRPVPPDGTWVGEVVTAFRGRPLKAGGNRQWP